MRKRWKRKSGYVTPNLTISKKELVREELFVSPYYDDWVDWRDGFRDWYCDFKTIKNLKGRLWGGNDETYEKRVKMNKKQKKLLRRRKARRYMKNLRGSY